MPILIFIIIGVCSYLPFQCEASPLSISDFKKIDPVQGEYAILGYIVKQYSCPPFSERRKPCMRNNVLISSKKELLNVYPSEGEYLVIFTEVPERLLLGNLYELKVIVRNSKSTGYGNNDLVLKEAKAVEPTLADGFVPPILFE